MKGVVVAVGCITLASARPATPFTFEAYKKQFHKSYASAEHEQRARDAFVTNDAAIAAHNAGDHKYWLGHNAFSDQTADEFVRGLKGLSVEQNRPRNFDYSLLKTPMNDTELDWVTRGAVTPVKNQGSWYTHTHTQTHTQTHTHQLTTHWCASTCQRILLGFLRHRRHGRGVSNRRKSPHLPQRAAAGEL